MVKYDETVIQSYADSLYGRAKWIVVQYALVGALLAGAVGALLAGIALGDRQTHFDGTSALIAGFLAGLVGTALGATSGVARGASLRLEAQTALCQAQIERNTRRA